MTDEKGLTLSDLQIQGYQFFVIGPRLGALDPSAFWPASPVRLADLRTRQVSNERMHEIQAVSSWAGQVLRQGQARQVLGLADKTDAY